MSLWRTDKISSSEQLSREQIDNINWTDHKYFTKAHDRWLDPQSLFCHLFCLYQEREYLERQVTLLFVTCLLLFGRYQYFLFMSYDSLTDLSSEMYQTTQFISKVPSTDNLILDCLPNHTQSISPSSFRGVCFLCLTRFRDSIFSYHKSPSTFFKSFFSQRVLLRLLRSSPVQWSNSSVVNHLCVAQSRNSSGS